VVNASGHGATSDASLDAVADALGPRAERRAPLGARTTYRVGGTAAVLVEVGGEDDLAAVHGALARAGAPVPVLVLGNGSNMLVADAGFNGLVVVPGPGLDTIAIAGSSVRAGAAALFPVVARRSAAAGLVGLEWAVGVPGSVGGALRMNAGGHGSDTAAVLARQRIFDLATGESTEDTPERLSLAYRHSDIGAGQVVVWAEFSLVGGDRASAMATVKEIVRWRSAHQPGGSNAGSVFTNPDGDAAGRLVEEAGLKGLRLGTARVSEKHANFIQADDGGSADDVRRLIDHVRRVVAETVGVRLRPEVCLVGFPDTTPATVRALPRPATRAASTRAASTRAASTRAGRTRVAGTRPGDGPGGEPSTSTGGRDL
jgi:UDP-N-acetylmuramate dehydrogenase